jgi:hypothetical protein
MMTYRTTSLRPALAAILSLALAGCTDAAGDDDAAATDATEDTEGDAAATDAADADDETDGADSGDDTGGAPLDTDLVGRFRLVGYEAVGATSLSLTDQNHNVELPGIGIVAGRANGLLQIEADRISFASALVFNDHIFPDPLLPNDDTALQARGGAAPGVLDGDTFTLAGSALQYVFTPGPGETLTQVEADGTILTWARADALPPTPALLAEGQATLFDTAGAPPVAPRMCLAWDLPGSSAVLTSDDVALSFTAGYAFFPVTAGAAPAEALADIGGTAVAVAHVVIYDDLDGDGAFDLAAGDELRAASDIGLAYRDETAPSEAFATSRFVDLLPGWQYVHFHADYAEGGATGLSPFDPTAFVSPDAVVSAAPHTEPVANVVP